MKNSGIILLFLLLCAGKLSAQGEYNMLAFDTDQMYNKYLLHTVYTQYDQRDSIYYTPLTRAQAESYGQQCKANYLEILGSLPQRTPLNVQVTAVHDMGDFILENILYESSPNRHVTANLYRPKAPGKYPAVIMLCGHSSSGKTSVGEQRSGARYAANGIVTMVVDPVSQGERNQLIDATGNQLARGGTTEHTLLWMNSMIVGESTVKDELWDNLRGLDYLESRPEVDGERLGCYGFSGGGTQSTYLLAFDDRIKVAGVGGFFSQRRRSLEILGASDGCQHIPGEGAKRLELTDFMAAFAPKPLVIVGGHYCFVDWVGADKGYKELQHLYAAHGAKENVYQYLGDDGHAYPKDKQDVVTDWFVKHLCGKNTPAVEANPFTPVPVSEMIASERGNLSGFFPHEVLIPKRNQATWLQYASERAGFARLSTRNQKATVAEVANIYQPAAVCPELRGTIDRGNYIIEKVILHAPGETPLPCLVFIPEVLGDNADVVIFTPENGKALHAREADKAEIMCLDGQVIVLADLRGIGETQDKPSRNDPKFYNREYTNGVLAAHIGESLVAQRARDYLMILDYLSQDSRFRAFREITVEAHGKCAPAALHAAVYDERIKALELFTNVPSWSSLLNNPTAWDQISYIVPGAGLHYDLPDLADALKRRNVQVTVTPQ